MKLPPGKYYIGDPCYVFDKSWHDLLNTNDCFQNDGITEFQGQKLWANGTAYGDGTYFDQNGNEYGVDAGLLGAVPIELIEVPGGEDQGTVIDFPNGLEVSYEDGVFYIGHIRIDTDPKPNEFDDEFDDPYGDEGEDEFI